jgi:two-component system chemotaxis sensor kinase CheA
MGDDLRKEIEALSEAMVLADVSDLRALADIHTHFETIAALADKDGIEKIADAARVAPTLIESIIMAETDDPEGLLDTISRTIAAMQLIVIDGRPEEEVEFPSGLGPGDDTDAESADSSEESPDTKAPASVVDPTLVSEFVTEAMEHLDNAEMNLLELESNPGTEDALHAVFRAFHTIKGVAGFLALGDVQKVSHEAETLLDGARKGELELSGAAVDVTFESINLLKDMIRAIRNSLETGQPVEPEHRIDKTVGKITSVLSGAPPDDEDDAEEPQAGVVPQISPARIKATRVRESVKVDSDRLNRLVDSIGELVIAHTMLAGADEIRDPSLAGLARLVTRLSKITRELQTMGTSLRMIPIRGVFHKMSVLARDLARKCGKKINFATSGEETELDKSIIDRISDPLVHLVRNAIDHGIEDDISKRTAAGKSEAGTVELRAYHRGGDVYIEIEDDGRGIDRQAVLRKAVERGSVDEGERLTDWEIQHLVLSPGFTTAPQVTDISGRGVGMDVVRDNVEALRGHIEIRSEEGKGSMFTIRLPLTLAIIDGLVVRVGPERYIIPTTSVIRSMRLSEQKTDTLLDSAEMLVLDDGLVPLVELHSVFKIQGNGNSRDDRLVVMVEADGRRAGLVADRLIGTQQTVIKSLGEAFQLVMGISGGAIMPDGRVGLIVDVDALVDLAYANTAHHIHNRQTEATGFTGSEAGGAGQ